MLLFLSYAPCYLVVMLKVGKGGHGREGRVVSTRAFGGRNGWESLGGQKFAPYSVMA